MIKFCVKQWARNEKNLRAHIEHVTSNDICYSSLVKMVVEHIFNDNPYHWTFDTSKMTIIDDGDYQGTIMFIIPRDTYQPSSSEYLMTYVEYGSCCCCDTLERIMSFNNAERGFDLKTVDALMGLCRDIVQRTIKPYNHGWYNEDIFDIVEVENDQI